MGGIPFTKHLNIWPLTTWMYFALCPYIFRIQIEYPNNTDAEYFDYFAFCVKCCLFVHIRRVWRYQRGNPNQNSKEEQTAQWPKEKVQKTKQRSTKHIYKTKDRVTQTPLKTGVNSHIHTVNNINKSAVRPSWIVSVVLYIYSSMFTNIYIMFSCLKQTDKGTVVVVIVW